MTGKITYDFSAEPWQYRSPGGWWFVSLPEALSGEIRTYLQWREAGWGRLNVTARVGKREWQTAIWFDTKKNTYLLPLKAEIRKHVGIEIGERYAFTIRI